MPRTANCEVQTLKIKTKSPLLVVGPAANLKGIYKQADGDLDLGDLVVRQTVRMVGERELAGVDLLMLTNASCQQNKTSSVELQPRRQFVWAPRLVRPENYRSGNILCFSELSRVWFIQEREKKMFFRQPLMKLS